MRQFKVVFLALFVLIFSSFLPQDDEILLSSGTYGVVDLPSGKNLKIDGIVNVGNINISGNNTIKITAGSTLNLSGSLHQNGKVILYNYGHIKVNNYEAQNGNNVWYNHGTFEGNIGQITDCSSKIKNYNSIKFTSFQANCGSIYIEDCAKFETGHLDINQDKIFSGLGFLSVLNSANINKIIAHAGLSFYYKNIVNSNYTEGLKLVGIDHVCPSLPILWESVKFSPNSVDFDVSSPEKIKEVIVEVSNDGINWKPIKRIVNIKEKNRVDL